jgi:hypothetical protein
MREAVEAFFDVGVQDIFGFLANGRENRRNRIVTGTPWAKPVAIGCEARLPFGIQTRRTGVVVSSRVRDCARARRWGGDKDLPPSTPAVRLPRLSCVTRRTARSLADQEWSRRRWSLRTVRTS